MVPDRQIVWTDGRRQNYIPLTSSGDNKYLGERITKDVVIIRIESHFSAFH